MGQPGYERESASSSCRVLRLNLLDRVGDGINRLIELLAGDDQRRLHADNVAIDSAYAD